MTNDRSAMADPSREERWAAAAVAAATGAVAEHYDGSGRQRAVDFVLRFPDGRTGALEVTSHAEPGTRELASLLRGAGFEWPNPGNWEWLIAFEPDARVKDVRKIYEHVICTCETHGVKSPDLLPDPLLHMDAVLCDAAWEELGVRFHGYPDSVGSAAVTLMPGALGGGVDEHLCGLPNAISDLLKMHHVAEHVAKTIRHGADEAHLFILIGPGGLPFAQYYTLCTTLGGLPTADPRVPYGLTNLWISTGYGESLIEWSIRTGWRAHDVLSRADCP